MGLLGQLLAPTLTLEREMKARQWIYLLCLVLAPLTWGCAGSLESTSSPQLAQDEPGLSENRDEPKEIPGESPEPQPPVVAPETFELVVVGGTGGGFYEFNDKVVIKPPAKKRKLFKKWTGPEVDLLLENPLKKKQSLRMPSHQVIIKADFFKKTPPHITKCPKRYLWKPESVGGTRGTLVILYPIKTEVRIFNKDRELIEKAYHAGYNHNGLHLHYYRFHRSGAGFPSPSIVRLGDKEYLVPDPSQRYDGL